MARTRRRAAGTTARLNIPDRQCYGCGSTEHLFRDCPNPTAPAPICWRCGSDGHLARECHVIIVDPSQVPPEQRVTLTPQPGAPPSGSPQHPPAHMPDPPSTTITYHYYQPPGPTYGPPPPGGPTYVYGPPPGPIYVPPPPPHMIPYGGYQYPPPRPTPTFQPSPIPQQPLRPGVYGPPATKHRFPQSPGAANQPQLPSQILRPGSVAQSQTSSGASPTTSISTSTPSIDATKDKTPPSVPPVKCYACGGDNHIAKNCTAKSSWSAFTVAQ